MQAQHARRVACTASGIALEACCRPHLGKARGRHEHESLVGHERNAVVRQQHVLLVAVVRSARWAPAAPAQPLQPGRCLHRLPHQHLPHRLNPRLHKIMGTLSDKPTHPRIWHCLASARWAPAAPAQALQPGRCLYSLPHQHQPHCLYPRLRSIANFGVADHKRSYSLQ